MKQLNVLEISRIVALCILGAITMAGYAFARAPIESLFLTHFESNQLPIVWLATPCVAAFVIGLFNRYNARYPLLWLFAVAAFLSAGVMSSLMLLKSFYPAAAVFLLYIWKDLYIVLLVEIFWSFSDIVFSIKTARWIYGVLLAFASLGGIWGNLMMNRVVEHWGTQAGLWMTAPTLLVAALVALVLARFIGDRVPSCEHAHRPRLGESLQVVLKSRYLTPLLGLVVVLQMCMTLIDYEFNSHMKLTYPQTDVRTQVAGHVHATVDFLSLIFQLLTGPILRYIGVSTTLILIPVLLMVVTGVYMVIPRLAMLITLKISSKVCDYSLLKAAREILYIPLTRVEKTMGKALIDIFVFRSAKAASSLVLLALAAMSYSSLQIAIVMFLLMVWVYLILIIVKRYEKALVPKVSNPD